jgi:hypothetical protein
MPGEAPATPALQRLPAALQAAALTPAPAYQAASGHADQLDTASPTPTAVSAGAPALPLLSSVEPVAPPAPTAPPIWPFIGGGALLVAAGALLVSERTRIKPEDEPEGML